MPLISTALDLRVLTPPPGSSSARPQAAVLSSLCREKMRREEGRAGKAEGASSPALSNLWELAPLITMTTGGGAAVSVAVAVTVGGQEIPLSDWLKGAGCLHCHPQQEVPNLRGLHVCSAQGRLLSPGTQGLSAGGSMSPANLREEEPGFSLFTCSLWDL